MAGLPQHNRSERHWIVGESGNRVQVVTAERWFENGQLINRYVSVEVSRDGRWVMVPGSASGHGDDYGDDYGAAKERVLRLLAGGWRDHVVRDVMKW